MIDATKIINGNLLTDFYGEWPSFHDSEVVSIQLDRDGPSLTASIYLFRMTSQIDERGYYILDKKAVVTLHFGNISELSIDGFNHQNVLFDLALNDISDRQLEDVRFEVIFDSSYGVGASFKCKDIEIVSLQAGPPEEVRVVRGSARPADELKRC